jgi:hypothetical protein
MDDVTRTAAAYYIIFYIFINSTRQANVSRDVYSKWSVQDHYNFIINKINGV